MESLLFDTVQVFKALHPLAVAFTWVVAVVLLASGIDDLAFDLTYWFQRAFRRGRFGRHERIPLEDLHGSPEKPIAVFVPAWREENVLEEMLTAACRDIDYARYDIFVGVYPNDPRTLEKARHAADRHPQVHIVILGHAGPSTRAQNLNEIFEGMLCQERITGVEYEIVVVHNAGDAIHPESLRVYNVFIPRYDMVQTPVFPSPAPHRQVVRWVYADELAESHTKDLPTRQIMSGFIPPGGGGTAYNRRILEFAGTSFGRNPFGRHSLAEDYDMALMLALNGANLAFLYRPFGLQVATRACFPATISAAVRQRSRWLAGICVQAWRTYGWQGGLFVRAMLYRDRKALPVHLFNALAYAVLLYVLLHACASWAIPGPAPLPPVVEKGTVLWYIVIADVLLMLWRHLQRSLSVSRVYGRLAGLLSVPRLAVGNMINFAAAVRAIGQAIASGHRGRAIPWEKTVHDCPARHDPVPG